MNKAIAYNPPPSLMTTGDGSSTLIHGVLGEMYHSRHGAWTESVHIFINHGLIPVLESGKTHIRIFEMGFGSGLNATLSREIADKYRVKTEYTSVELYPLTVETVSEMAMPEMSLDERSRWLALHQLPWGDLIHVSPYFSIRKLNVSFPEGFPENSPVEEAPFDLVFYDAFAPAAQPGLWGPEALGTCFNLLGEKGLWFSYCAKGQVRRTLKEVGFEVEALPGPPGKREITRAIKMKRGNGENDQHKIR